jgi:internalin A
MMKHFELCYESDGTFLVPDLLTKQEPDTGSWKDALHFEVKYDVLPTSIISRLIVRMHTWISKGTVWRTGLVVTMDRNRALIRGDREDATVRIAVHGPASGRRGLLTAIRTELRSINETIPGLAGEERVPVPGHERVWVPYGHLVDLEAAGREVVIPQGLTEELPVRDLLAGVETPSDRNDELAAVALRLEPNPNAGAPIEVDATPWTPTEALRFGRNLLGAIVVLVYCLRWCVHRGWTRDGGRNHILGARSDDWNCRRRVAFCRSPQRERSRTDAQTDPCS